MGGTAILLVDDEAILLLSLKQSLRQRFGAGCRCETAMNGVSALEFLRVLESEGVEVILVISDWLMPQMNGDEFLMRVHELYPSIKLVMLSGHADDSDMTRLAERVKLEAFLYKPWSSERLFEIVARALGQAPGQGPGLRPGRA